MREKLITFLINRNNEENGELIDIDIPNYVDKILKNATIISIVKKEILKGFIAFYANDEKKLIAFLTMIVVEKNSVNMGYGKALLELSIKEVKKGGFKFFRLEVKQENVKAIKMYESNGFKSMFTTDGKIFMEKEMGDEG